MNSKDAHWIRLKEIAKIAEHVTIDKVIDQNKVKELEIEVSAMLRQLLTSSHSKHFFKRLS